MNKTLTEKKVLKKLQIKDFRHLSKDKVMIMASMIDKMEPDVAKKVLEQFPDFSNTMREVLEEYKLSLDKALELNNESVKSYYETCNSIISTLRLELDKDGLSFDEKRYIVEQMIVVAKMKGDKDSENKSFIVTLSVLGLSAIGLTASALLVSLGGNTKFDTGDLKRFN